MLRIFEDVSIKVAGVDIGRFAGVVEFSVHPDQVDTVAIHVEDETSPSSPTLTLTEGGSTITASFFYCLLRAALLERFATDLMTYATALRAREPRVLRSVA